MDLVLLNLFKKWFNFGRNFIKQMVDCEEELQVLLLQPLDSFLDFQKTFPKTLNFLENLNDSFKINEYLQIWQKKDSNFFNCDLIVLV